MKFVLSTIRGVESIAKKEIEKQGGKIEEVIDRLITFSGEKENVLDFDSLFDLIKGVNCKQIFKKDFPIVVKSSSIRSELFSAITIQSIGKSMTFGIGNFGKFKSFG